MRDYSATPSRGGSCVSCCQVCIFAFTAFLIVAERTALIYCFVYYLWVGHNYCYAYLAGFTALFLLPGWGPQWLSYLWYLSDGRIRMKSLTWTHILHLGIFQSTVHRPQEGSQPGPMSGNRGSVFIHGSGQHQHLYIPDWPPFPYDPKVVRCLRSRARGLLQICRTKIKQILESKHPCKGLSSPESLSSTA